MPCGHHAGHHYGYVPPSALPCPYCGNYHAGYGPAWHYGWPGPAGYGPPTGWTPSAPPPAPPSPWAPRGYGPAVAPAMSDEDIRGMVDSALRADPRIPPQARIQVQVREGVVALTGSVPDKWVKRVAGDIVFALPGVEDVQNNLQVTRSGGRRSETGGAT